MTRLLAAVARALPCQQPALVRTNHTRAFEQRYGCRVGDPEAVERFRAVNGLHGERLSLTGAVQETGNATFISGTAQ
jgi:hypothetical protein